MEGEKHMAQGMIPYTNQFSISCLHFSSLWKALINIGMGGEGGEGGGGREKGHNKARTPSLTY